MFLRRSLAALVVAAALAGCGGSSSGAGHAGVASSAPATQAPSAPPTSSAADVAAVTQVWQTFFTAAGPIEAHIALLQNGSSFRAELTASSKDPNNQYLVAKVTHVVVTGATAAVTYNLLSKGGVALLTGAVGQAVQVGGQWLVSKQTYCGLISLQDPKAVHPGCG